MARYISAAQMRTPDNNKVGLVHKGFGTLHYILNGGSDDLFLAFCLRLMRRAGGILDKQAPLGVDRLFVENY